MQSYPGNKLKTAFDIVRRIDNWPTALDLRLRRRASGLRLLRFREGLNVICRAGTRDWDVVHELLFAGSYMRALGHLSRTTGAPLVLDLGGNLGLFSLLAASAHPRAQIHSYEPGPPNVRLFQMNLLANPDLADRIHLHQQAVGGHPRETDWYFNESNPGGSSLFGANGQEPNKFRVEIQSFAEVLESLPAPVDMAKIDIEGAEFEVLAETPPALWQKVRSVSLELHHDPEKRTSQEEFLARMAGYGYRVEEETVCSYFMHRQPD